MANNTPPGGSMGRREAPIPDGPLHDFAQSLRELRAQAPGRPTYRELARVACFSQSVLSVAAAGRSLPTWEVTLAYVEACGGDAEQWHELWTKLYDTLRTTNPALITEPRPTTRQDAAPGLPTAVTRLRRSDPAGIGPFRLLGRLGGGAMGQVYLGMSRAGRPVSVKVVHPHLADDPTFRRRFAAEVAAVRRVHGIYTPAVVDADPGADLPWMATAYVAGPSLRQVVDTEGPLPPDTVSRLAAGIAEALIAIHGAGVLHRDLTPANVLLDPDGPKVIDFGVSFTNGGTTLTQTGDQVGTFLTPEQVNGQPLTGAADLFALGSLLAYAATGIAPFGDGAPGEVLYRIAHAAPDPAALACQNNTLRDLVVRCLDKDPDRRPTPEQIIDACSLDRPRWRWLPTPTAERAAGDKKDVTDLVNQAAARRRRTRYLRRAALPALAVAMAAVLAVVLIPRFTAGPPPRPASPYALVYQDRRLTLPDYNYYIDLVAGTVVEGHGLWTMSSDSGGGNGRGAFELPDATTAYIPAPSRPTMTADQCAAGVATSPAKTAKLGDSVILRFDWVPPGTSFCLLSQAMRSLAVIRVIDTDSGNYGAKLAIDYYEHS